MKYALEPFGINYTTLILHDYKIYTWNLIEPIELDFNGKLNWNYITVNWNWIDIKWFRKLQKVVR